MSRNDQTIYIDTEDPEFFTELLSRIPRSSDRRQSSDGQYCRNVPGIQNIDFGLSQRLQSLLDTLADISLHQRRNVSATMASIKENENTGIPETKLYIVFNHEDDGSAHGCQQHLQNIFHMLHQVPLRPATDGSPKVIPRATFENDVSKICEAIHNYSFDIFYYRLTKRKDKFSEIQRYIEQDHENFSELQRSMLLKFLRHVKYITDVTTDALATKQLPIDFIKDLIKIYSHWTHYNLLPEDPSADDKSTLLYQVDIRLNANRVTNFKLQRWALKIMSFVISASRLFRLTQSARLHKFIRGNLSIQVLRSATTPRYHCYVSSETILAALNAAMDETHREVPDDWDTRCEWAMQKVLGDSREPIDVERKWTTVHAELAMIIAMVNGEVNDVSPYIGVSKLSCTMCSHYIDAFNEVRREKIVTKGSHGKAYPGWFWPICPDLDEELRPVVLGRVRWQLLSDVGEGYTGRRMSDSTVGSDGPEFEKVSDDEIEEIIASRSLSS